MRWLIAVMIAVVLWTPAAAQAGSQAYEIAGRRVILYTPPGLGDRPAPLILMLHGGGGNARHFQRDTNFEAQARRSRFRLAYVDGSPIRLGGARALAWNAGRCCGPPAERGADDAGVLVAVIKAARSRGLVGEAPVWILGHSNGGMMAYRMACEHGALISGVMVMAGTLMVDRCAGARGVSVLHIHGDADRNVPTGGGQGENTISKAHYRSLEETERMMRRAGAKMRVIIAEGGAHKLRSLEAAMNAQLEMSLGELLDRAVHGGTSR